jgi:hypothetical protein
MAAYCAIASAAPHGSQQPFVVHFEARSAAFPAASLLEMPADPYIHNPGIDNAQLPDLAPLLPKFAAEKLVEQSAPPPARPVLAPAVFSSVTLLAFSGVFAAAWHSLRNTPGRRRRGKYVARTMACL